MKTLNYSFFAIAPAFVLLASLLLPLKPETGVMVFNVGLAIGCLAFLLGIIWVFEKKREQGMLLATVSSIYVLIALAVQMYRISFPAVMDMSTDLVNPPSFIEIAKDQDYQNRDLLFSERMKTLQEKFYPKLTGLAVDKSAEAVYTSLLELLRSEKGVQIVAAHPEQRIVEATAVSGWFKFREDFVVRVTELEANKSRVDIRARNHSQNGAAGANFRRIVRVLDIVDNKLVKPEGVNTK